MIACMKMVFANELARPVAAQVSCAACGLGYLCRAEAAEGGVDASSVYRRRLQAGELLFEAGTPQSALYAVHAGFLKTSKPLHASGYQVVGLHIMGDVLGLDGIASHMHATDAVALTSCEVCVIAFGHADRLMERDHASGARLRALLSNHVARASDQFVTLGSLSAQQRVAAFLLDMSDRWGARGYSATAFDLCMTRKDIGSYLGLTFETVSRMLSEFRDSGWLRVEGRRVELIDRAQIEHTLGAVAPRR
jgi:CRP/FNR family transcriptional regulator